MAGLKLKSGADFCNFEAFRMRLHNDGEDPTSDFGVGQIYFNTSDTSVGSARHVRLYDGTKFRSLAYLDEIAKNEAFLALKDKVDLLSGDVDTDAIISNMKEVSAFLEGFAEDASLMDYLNTELGKKLDKTGGTIKGSSEHPLIIDTYGEKICLYFGVKGSIKTEVGWDGSNGAYLYNYATGEQLSLAPTGGVKLYINSKFETLLHSGNVGEYALPLTGGTIDGGSNDVPLVLKSSGTTTWLKFTTNDGKNRYIGVGEDNTLKFQYGGASYPILHSGNVGDYALKTDGSNAMQSSLNMGANVIAWGVNNGLQYLGTNADGASLAFFGNGFSDWKTIAFTDSDITGNAATANGFARAFINVANADLNTALAQGGIASNYNIHISKHWQNAPDGALYGGVIQFFTDNRLDAQLLWDINHGNSDDTTRSLWWRAQDDRGFDNAKWHQIAFTDSNVASAQALIHSNGTVGATVSEAGNLSINKRISSADDSLNLFEYSAGFLYLGYSLRNEHTTRVYGNKIEFLTGDTPRMLINSSGNVTIGNGDHASSDYKLFVYGNSVFADTSRKGDINTTKISSSAIVEITAIAKGNDGLYIGQLANSTAWLQSAYGGTDANASSQHTYPLSLQPLGGNVLIGTTTDNGAKLQVGGDISIPNNHYIAFSNTAQTPLYQLWMTGNDVFFVGRGSVENGHDSVYCGKTIRFATGNSAWNNSASIDEEGNFHITGNLIVDGEVSAGGAAEEGGNAGSGAGAFHSESIAVGATQTTIAHGLGTDDIVVSIYEKDGVSGRWSIILTDVEIVDANNIIVSFGSATTVEHKVVIMGAVA